MHDELFVRRSAPTLVRLRAIDVMGVHNRPNRSLQAPVRDGHEIGLTQSVLVGKTSMFLRVG
jgi:hypothetical protein